MITIHQADCLDLLRTLDDASVDAIVTDPPYGLADHKPKVVTAAITAWTSGDREHVPDGKGFMGRAWDAFVPPPAVWDECLRVLKPGGHLLCFAGTRTVDLMGLSIRLAGFEIRDSITHSFGSLVWIYGSGFPKSLSVPKAVHSQVDSRYGSARCDCLVSADGRPDRDGIGSGNRPPLGPPGGPGQVQAPEATDLDVPLDASADIGGLRELRETNSSETAGPPQVGPTVLLSGMRECRPEAQGLGDAALRAGMEEQASRGPQAGQGVPFVREDAGGERDRAARPSPGAVSVRGDQSAGKPSSAVRSVSSRDRSGDGSSASGDPARHHPRRTHPDSDGRRGPAVARVCSWCGLPDPAWLTSLEGLGTALKPASEPIIVARKPLGGTVAANVIQHGTGGLNVDACRVAHGADVDLGRRQNQHADSAGMSGLGTSGFHADHSQPLYAPAGRWPSNVVLSHGPECGVKFYGEPPVCQPGCPVAELDAQSGTLTSGSRKAGDHELMGYMGADVAPMPEVRGDSGGASRFFPVFKYQAKAPTKERPKVDGVSHPTVKPLALMRWLVRLVAPPGGLVLDPFAGSGTTGEAAALEGFRAVLVEAAPEHIPLIAARLTKAELEFELVVPESEVHPDPEPVQFEPAVPQTLLELIAEAADDAALTALWEAHSDVWAAEHTAAVKARLAVAA